MPALLTRTDGAPRRAPHGRGRRLDRGVGCVMSTVDAPEGGRGRGERREGRGRRRPGRSSAATRAPRLDQRLYPDRAQLPQRAGDDTRPARRDRSAAPTNGRARDSPSDRCSWEEVVLRSAFFVDEAQHGVEPVRRMPPPGDFMTTSSARSTWPAGRSRATDEVLAHLDDRRLARCRRPSWRRRPWPRRCARRSRTILLRLRRLESKRRGRCPSWRGSA